MKTLGLLTACFVFAASANAQTAPKEGLSVQHFEPLRGMQMRADGPLGRDGAILYEPIRMEFDALGRRFDLELEPNTNLVSPDERARLDTSIGVYRGRLAGNPDSWARIVTRDGVPSGLIWDGRELLGIERPGQSAFATTEPVIFRLADMVIEAGTMSCAVGGPEASAAEMYKGLVAELQMVRADGAVEEIEIGAVVDALFANGRSNAAQDVLDRLNNVDGIYSSELGIQITVPVVDVFDSQSDPFTATTDGGDLLDEVGAFRVANAPQRQAGLTHLFTGRDLDGSTVGIAYVGALCNNFFGVGLSEGTRGIVVDSLIAAHEIGHNFGASHDGDADGTCPDEPDNLFIMAASVTGSMEFSSCSRDVMTASAAVASCVVPLAAVDVSVTSLGQAEDILLGRAINLTFEVPNDGSENATGVTVDVDLPQNVTFVAAAASQGNSTQGAGTVSFNLGTVAAFSAASVTVTASTDAVGPAAFTATVSATNDGITTNNVDVHTVDIDPAVDLVVSAPNVAATIDSSAVASVTVRNTSILDATALEATVTLDAGIRADSANWTAGTCTVADQRIDCVGSGLAAQASSTLTIGLTGLQTGSISYTVEVESAEIDTDESDNAVSGVVTVSQQTATGGGGGGGGDGGGGAPGWLFLSLLAAAAARRLRAPGVQRSGDTPA